MTDACRFCKRPIEACHEKVDARFPEAAQDAYALAHLTTAPKCEAGQRADMKATQHGRRLGWSLDRAVASTEWAGEIPEGVDPLVTANRRPLRPLTHRDRDRLEKELRR